MGGATLYILSRETDMCRWISSSVSATKKEPDGWSMKQANALMLAFLFLAIGACTSRSNSYVVVKKEKPSYFDLGSRDSIVVLEHQGVRLTTTCGRWWAKGTKKPTMDSLPAEGSDNDCSDLPIGKQIELERSGDGLFYFYYDNGCSKEILLNVMKEQRM